MFLNTIRIGFCLIVFMGVQACMPMKDAQSPIKWKRYHTAQTKTENLLILLPGIRNDLLRFEQEGFFTDIQQYAPNFDVITVDAHIGYYAQKKLIVELHETVILPAKASGYRNIILGGISLGGYGSLWYNHLYANEIQGLLLIAPYLGDEHVISSIKSSPSVAVWREQNPLDVEEFEELVWHWIDEDMPSKQNQTLLAVGKKDKYYDATNILARYLPESQYVIGKGKHNWRDWRVLWLSLLKDKKINALFNKQ